jgi:Leucine-rich repeat (LRR) protein
VFPFNKTLTNCFPPRILDGLSSDVPVELSLLEHLEEIIIQKGSMKGSLPINMFTVPSLKHIDLDKNELSGIIEVDGESSVQRLDINFNKFSGSIDFLTSFPNITEAHLDNNSFNGTIPASLGDLTNLRKFNFD